MKKNLTLIGWVWLHLPPPTHSSTWAVAACLQGCVSSSEPPCASDPVPLLTLRRDPARVMAVAVTREAPSSWCGGRGFEVSLSPFPADGFCVRTSALPGGRAAEKCKGDVFPRTSRTPVTRWAACYGASSPSARKSQVGVSPPPRRVSTSSSFPTTARKASCGRSCATQSA